jgi:hypothetical protein
VPTDLHLDQRFLPREGTSAINKRSNSLRSDQEVVSACQIAGKSSSL